MKHSGLSILCLLFYFVGHTQPTGSSGIYFSITDRSGDDSIVVTDKLRDTQFDNKAGFRIDGYLILDLGEKQYGFHKRTYHPYPCKAYFWYEENIFSITSPEKQTMTIRFLNLPVAYYFIHIPFQAGSFVLSFPKDSSSILLEKYFRRSSEGEMYYGYDISPADWSKHRESPDQPADRVKTSIIPQQ
jgi:hypothetical protein